MKNPGDFNCVFFWSFTSTQREDDFTVWLETTNISATGLDDWFVMLRPLGVPETGSAGTLVENSTSFLTSLGKKKLGETGFERNLQAKMQKKTYFRLVNS